MTQQSDETNNPMMEIEPAQPAQEIAPRRASKTGWIWNLLLLVVLLVGAYFRFVGIDWDQNQHLHPDERFMTMVVSSISTVQHVSDYFNTQVSSLNPNNRGYSFYVYGTLPLFMVRFVGEAIGQTGYGQIYLVGRYLSGLMDLLSVLFVYMIAVRLYKNRGLGLLAAAFSALAVLQIQLSHFFTVDTYTNFFLYLGIYCAVWVLTEQPAPATENVPTVMPNEDDPDIENGFFRIRGPITPRSFWIERPRTFSWHWLLESWWETPAYILFGISLGLAMASKVSAVPLAVLIAAAAVIRYMRLEGPHRWKYLVTAVRDLFLAALVAFVLFRIFQPYAFSGPGFFGIKLNPHWLDSLKELSQQSSGDVDFPPALQWARRPITFAWDNMVQWGLGLPLGLLAWGGFLWMTWRMIKGEWHKHALLWVWTTAIFVWQSIDFSRSMRYQLPIYPALAIIAAWAVFTLWERGSEVAEQTKRWFARNGRRSLALVLGIGVLGSTFAWAYAFTRIYTRPVTRIAASQWIYQNVPAAINLDLETSDGDFHQPLAFTQGMTIFPNQATVLSFIPQTDGELQSIHFSNIVAADQGADVKTLVTQVSMNRQGDKVLTAGMLMDAFSADTDPRGKDYQMQFESAIQLKAGQQYFVIMNVSGGSIALTLNGTMNLVLATPDGTIDQFLADPVDALVPGKSHTEIFSPQKDGLLRQVYLPHMVDWQGFPDNKTVTLDITDLNNGNALIGKAQITNPFSAGSSPHGAGYTFQLETPAQVTAGKNYTLRLALQGEQGSIGVYGTTQAIESSWDDSLPIPLDNYDPFDLTNGLYRSELNFEMYWDDNADKLQRFEDILNQADILFSSSGRQWGTTVRVPERYPLTTAFYRDLLGCPPDKDVVWCYRVAQPGMFQGRLGYDLVYVNQSDPNLGPLHFNDQFAEEAFTVYDHPKVMIWKKRADYSAAQVRSLLGSVDLRYVVHLTPAKASSYPGNLMLPLTRLVQQQAGGTWSQLFVRGDVQNRFPAVALALWYVVIFLLGVIVYPFVRLALGGLQDKGYPLARMVGMLLLAWLVWLAGSSGIPFSRLTISIAALLLLAANLVLFLWQRKAILAEIKRQRRYILFIEALALAFFVFFLLIRLGNPDLWHPYKGGEKPMDFSYLNAVLKSTTFPPYDPWFADGYINYYYYGFVVVGVIIKWLGIIPAIAYNIFLPSLFSLLALGAFSVGWNLLAKWHPEEDPPDEENKEKPLFGLKRTPLYGGVAAALGLQVLGNLGTVRMIWEGLQRLVQPAEVVQKANLLQSIPWALQGLSRFLSGSPLPYAPGDWYWIPSRAILEGNAITEFPFFTFLYADPHAHLYALPITVVGLAWGLSILRGKWQWGSDPGQDEQSNSRLYKTVRFLSSFLLGGLVFGALRATNTWDMPTYLALGGIAVLYVSVRNADVSWLQIPGISIPLKRWMVAVGSVLLLVVLSFVMYQPFAQWYAQGYTTFIPWKGDHTDFASYMTHWILPLFVLISWMVWETRQWMAQTPLSSLKKLYPYRVWLWGLFGLMWLMIFLLTYLGVHIAWFVILVGVWVTILLLRPGQPDAKRAVLFMAGTGLMLTLAVELIVLDGDIERMNTVFKFYLQVWTLFNISAAAALFWLIPAVLDHWSLGWRGTWQTALGVLVGGALLFPLLAGADKIHDRMSMTAPHTLNGMAYMATSTYNDQDVDMNLNEDYNAIIWMQDHVQGSPVIVEGNTPEYRWGSRFTIYTGLPGVVGWNWHQRQQRGMVSADWVTERVKEIGDFYNATERAPTLNFLHLYNVRYIIMGQLEKAYYPGPGLEKFAAWNGDLWQEVYRDGTTVIYQVK